MSDLQQFLRESLEDNQLSRKERRSLQQALSDMAASTDQLLLLRSQAFDLAQEKITADNAESVVAWLEDVTKVLFQHLHQGQNTTTPAQAYFSPGQACVNQLRHLISSAKKQVDICVFTITDDRLSEPILATHRRGVAVRIITDNDKLTELGSDIRAFADAGIPIRIDQTDFHMHHKFALFDNEIVVTGSYNWTRSAAEYNQENIVVSADANLRHQFSEMFERLWHELQPYS